MFCTSVTNTCAYKLSNSVGFISSLNTVLVPGIALLQIQLQFVFLLGITLIYLCSLLVLLRWRLSIDATKF
jgi:hypothetical protein